ncbi:MAG: rRNA synthase [Actinomycetota bacterium]|nr:rRNA synthase [Actinomycetota bacterium]
MISFSPSAAEVGSRTDLVLARRAGVSRRSASSAVAAGDVLVAGRRVRPGHRLGPEEVVEGSVEEPARAAPGAEDISLEVRYSDDRVLVVSKPAGLVTHPAGGHDSGTLVNALLGLGLSLSGEGTERPGIVHRLDKGTSGLLLVARDDEAHASLTRSLRAHRIERTYLALVRGRPPAASGTIEAPIARHPRRRTVMAVVPEGRPAVSHYRVLDRNEDLSLLEVRLETGRTHQIRVHLSHIGHPVLGDAAYGGVSELSRRLSLARPFLHAIRLSFPHPGTGVTVEVEDELPGDLRAVLDAASLRISPAPRGAGHRRPIASAIDRKVPFFLTEWP